ncbi:KASH domain-containing protein [Caerostris extrusa]|uniref:KASH domain-containing protein n=1 Tax=Caerostris extrusa TaxID=172846 RepID=A0AAV4R5C1_CAEEX|nr:KASH domain-containing protein [Caerostris extrusa]
MRNQVSNNFRQSHYRTVVFSPFFVTGCGETMIEYFTSHLANIPLSSTFKKGFRNAKRKLFHFNKALKNLTSALNHREASDFELDEGPLNKHRRLTLDRWTAVNSTANMDKMRMERNKTTNVIKTGLLTKDIGVLCSDLIPVNDKCIMVGTTGIAALKAEYGDDFTNFEIIQDVGYSSESSTHLSSDDGISVGGDRYFNIRVYNYADEKTPPKTINLKEDLDKADSSKQSSSLASSVGSSSGAPSFNDSGLGAADLLVTRETTSPEIDKTLLTDDCDPYDLCLPGEESDFLETVLDNCVDFCTSESEKDGNGIDDLQYNLSGIESDDSADNFHNKSVNSDGRETRARPGFEPGTSRTQIENHTPRPPSRKSER